MDNANEPALAHNLLASIANWMPWEYFFSFFFLVANLKPIIRNWLVC